MSVDSTTSRGCHRTSNAPSAESAVAASAPSPSNAAVERRATRPMARYKGRVHVGRPATSAACCASGRP